MNLTGIIVLGVVGTIIVVPIIGTVVLKFISPKSTEYESTSNGGTRRNRKKGTRRR